MLRTQRNARVHAAVTVAVLALGAFVRLAPLEWALVGLAVAAVWSAEAFNTALEQLGDVVSPEHHPLIGKAKDVAAGAVLLAAIGAMIVGLAVFGRRLLS